MKNVKTLCNCILSASLILGSSFSPVFADPEPDIQDGITINGGSSATIQGYQTDIPQGYSVSVTWGSLSFVYDKGNYVPLTGTLARATTNQDYAGVEAGATDGNVGKWYGFDGTNNKVEVTNLSTGNITLGASVAKSEGEASGEEVFTLYFPDTYKDESHALAAGDDTYATFNVNHDLAVNETPGLTMYKESASSAAISGVNLAAHGRDSTTGELTATTDAQKFGFYLNITGAPSNAFSTDSSDLDDIGTITLNFTIPV